MLFAWLSSHKFHLKFQAQVDITLVMQCNKVLLLFLLLLKALHLFWTQQFQELKFETL